MDEDKAQDVLALAIGLTVVAVLTVGALSDVPWPDLFAREEPAARPRPARPLGSPEPPPPLGPNEVAELPPITAEYVASVVCPAYQPERRAEVIYGGGWSVEHSTTDAGDRHSHYEHLASGAHFGWTRSEDRARELVSVSEREPRPAEAVAYTNTGRTRREGAETCTIWTGRWRSQPSYGERPPWQMCITDDGIRLWSRIQEYDLPERESYRVTSLERRAISAAEARPPAQLLDWRYWRGSEERSGAGDLAVDMASAPSVGQQDEQVLRIRGEWTSTFINDNPHGRHWIITGPNVYLHYIAYEGRARSLDISRGRQRSGQMTGTLCDPPRSETIVGRRCDWFDLPAPSHSFATECRTRDGLTLAIHSGGDGVQGGDGLLDVRATRVSRAPLPASAVAPPAEAFQWPGSIR